MKTLSLKGISVLVAIAIVLGVIATQTWAGEKGRFRGRAVLYATKYDEIKVPGTSGDVVYHGEQDGVIFNETGGTFLANARYQVVFKGEVSKGAAMAEGYKTFTMSDGSQVFAKWQGRKVADKRWNGTWTLIGGTGRYQGVRGQGTFDFTDVADKVGWDILEGEYEVP